MKFLVIAVVMAAGPAMAQTAAEPLELVCGGVSQHVVANSTFANVNTNQGASAFGSATSYRKAKEEDTLRLTLDGKGGGKVKLPSSIVPPISRGKDGWWDFVKLDVTDAAITGQISLNLINKPKVVVDRHNGDVDVSGFALGFRGNCEKVTQAPEEKKF